MAFDQQGGTTYTFPNVTAFLANQPSGIQYAGDISAPSVFNNGATGMRHTRQQYFVAFAQDEWQLSPRLTLNYGLRYEYYTPLKVEDDLIVKFNLETGQLDPNTIDLHGTKKNNVQPRAGGDLQRRQDGAPRRLRRLRRAGPGRGPDPADRERPRQHARSAPVRCSRSRSTRTRWSPTSPATRTTAATSRAPTPRSTTSRRRSTSTRRRCSRSSATASPRRRPTSAARAATCSCAASPTRSSTSSPTRTRPARRSSSASSRSSSATPPATSRGVQNPYAEVDFKTSGGHDEYNAMMLSLNRRSASGLAMNVQYTLGRSRGTSGGSNEANTAAQQRADAGAVRVRERLQQLRRPPHVQPERALLAAVRPGPDVRQPTPAR